MWKDIADMNYRGFKREKAKVADAKREGAYAALMRYNDYLQVSDIPMNPYAYADKHYAPTPARSVTLPHDWRVTFTGGVYEAERIGRGYGIAGQPTAFDLCKAICYTPTTDEYTALCALAREDR